MSASGITAAPVPFMSLERHHAPIADELRRAFDAVLAEGGFVLGREVDRFEREFADYCGTDHCVGVGSGTAALSLALRAAGIGPGDEVIVPAHTYIATALAVTEAGAVPVFCDVEDGSGLIDVSSAAATLSERTAAILPVHLYGQVCDMDAVIELARRHSLLVVEDAAQAHGATLGAARAGSIGDVAAFSFYPSKNLGALGDGGAICTGDEQIAARARRLRNLGQESKGVHVEVGVNDRLDGIQAAMLRVKLHHLDEWNAARRRIADAYRRSLEGSVRTLVEERHGECVYHLFPVRTAARGQVRAALAEHGIGAGVHYWPAVHRQPPYDDDSGELPIATRWSEEVLTLPIFPELTEVEVSAVAESLQDAIEVCQ